MAPDRTETDSARDTSASLCLSCGLCCDASFFGSVELQPADDAAALGALLPLERKGDKVVFRQRCPALRGTCCSIYTQRPLICRGYRCRLLRGVQEQPALLPAALEKVTGLVAAFAKLKAQLRQAGYLTVDPEVPEAFKAFRGTYTTALKASDADFFRQNCELILRWKKIAWLLLAFDEKVAARFALPVQPATQDRRGE
jgi:Fe-S-cluster containining protein